MSEKPEALRLADECDWSAKFKAAKELRRLHAENEKLQEALKWSLKNGVVYHRTYDTDEVFFSDAGCGCCSSLTEPPPHLQEMILKIAREEKT